MIGVYSIQIGEALYVGASKDIDKRHKTHLKSLMAGTHHSKPLQIEFDFLHDPARVKFKLLQEFQNVSDLTLAERTWQEKLNALGGKSQYPKQKRDNFVFGFTWRLEQTMDDLGITQYALQKHSGIALNTIRSLCKGETSRPDLQVLSKLMRSMNEMGHAVELADVLEYVPDEKQS
jgi:DNA-binding Xre family transcriptional regulator/predicted GIY-YIG superfamily endonuclease